MKTVHAIYEGGVFRPLEPVALPEKCRVELELRIAGLVSESPDLDAVVAILSKRFNSGERYAAERHNEHQP